MRTDAIKGRLINRDQIKMAVSVFVDHGVSKEDIFTKIVSIFNVELDQLDDVLCSPDDLELDFQKSPEKSGVVLGTSIETGNEQFKLMVATKYWNGLSENNIQ